MDPLTQGALGACLSQSKASNKEQKYAFILGALSGMAPDLDILIRSKIDSLLYLEFHRQFTHSLIFIPFGALVCALLFHPFVKKKIDFSRTYLYCLLGYATHGLLDACTSYGTQLYWPFSNARASFDIISIIDPLFTLPLLALIVFGLFKRRSSFAKAALIYCLIYFGLGKLQQYRAISFAKTRASILNLNVLNYTVRPSFANLLVWKVIYETEREYHVEALRLGTSVKVYEGESIIKLEYDDSYKLLEKDSVHAKDVERFRWFSNGHIALDKDNKNHIIDVRYSVLPHVVSPMWGIVLDYNNQNTHVTFKHFKNKSRQDRLIFLLKLIKGESI